MKITLNVSPLSYEAANEYCQNHALVSLETLLLGVVTDLATAQVDLTDPRGKILQQCIDQHYGVQRCLEYLEL